MSTSLAPGEDEKNGKGDRSVKGQEDGTLKPWNK